MTKRIPLGIGANCEAEEKRVAGIVQRPHNWSNAPTLPLMKIVELTNMSRSRIIDLVDRGVFKKQSGKIIVASVRQHFANRLARLAAAVKSRKQAETKVSAGYLIPQFRQINFNLLVCVTINNSF